MKVPSNDVMVLENNETATAIIGAQHKIGRSESDNMTSLCHYRSYLDNMRFPYD